MSTSDINTIGDDGSGDPALSDYDPSAYPPFAVTADVVVFTIVDDVLQVVLVRRGEPPFKDRWALPGGFVRPDEAPHQAARRQGTSGASRADAARGGGGAHARSGGSRTEGSR